MLLVFLDKSITPYSLQSSANNLHTLYLTLDGKSLIKQTNSIGPMTEPWGIPLTTGFHSDFLPSTITHCFLPVRNEFIHFKILPFIPKFFYLTNSLLCGTESNAFAKSVYATSNT